jgi:hypothetical protein
VNLSSEEREQLAPFLEYNVYLDEGHGCWLWKLRRTKYEYSVLWFKDKNIHVHRISYAVFNENFDDYWHVLHKCDVRPCINPEHLFLGTNTDNNADMVAKGRQAKGERHGMFGKRLTGSQNGMFGRTGEKTPLFGKVILTTGEKNNAAKLKEHQIPEILRRYETGLTQCQIAKEYGIAQCTVSAILRGRSWKHIQRSS